VFGIRSCKLFRTSFGETPDPRQPTGGGHLIGQDRAKGQPEKQWLRSMMQQHTVLAVACLRGVINSSRQTDPLRPVYRANRIIDTLLDSGGGRMLVTSSISRLMVESSMPAAGARSNSTYSAMVRSMAFTYGRTP
jgi:hypothetical protein